jgi:hypothetical protein
MGATATGTSCAGCIVTENFRPVMAIVDTFTAADYFYYHNQLSIHAYYPLYLLLAVMTIWMAAVAFLRQEPGVLVAAPPFLKPPLPAEMKQKGIWLKKAVQAGLYYQDPELSLSSLAEKLELSPMNYPGSSIQRSKKASMISLVNIALQTWLKKCRIPLMIISPCWVLRLNRDSIPKLLLTAFLNK